MHSKTSNLVFSDRYRDCKKLNLLINFAWAANFVIKSQQHANKTVILGFDLGFGFFPRESTPIEQKSTNNLEMTGRNKIKGHKLNTP